MAEVTRMLFDNKIMLKAINDFETEASKLEGAGKALIKNLNESLKNFEGATKDVIVKKIGEEDSDEQSTLAYFVVKQVPQMLKNLATLLEANRSTLEQGDRMLADQISGNGK